MKTSELHYELPAELIAQRPAETRDVSRLLVLDRATGARHVEVFRDVARWLRRGDCLVLNDTRVIRARLRGRKATGGRVEIFLLHQDGPETWEALVNPSARVKPGASVLLPCDLAATVGEVLPNGRRRVAFDRADVLDVLEQAGEVPLPPYIRRERPDEYDAERYQTVYARTPGAVAAPTAGLHFTDEVFASLEHAGIRRTTLTLHVGYGTFRPIQAERLEEHQLDAEDFEVSPAAASLLNETRASDGRIIAVGTTSTRVLETQFQGGAFQSGQGITNCYIYPPYEFQAVDALLTNFHLPRSSLLALVCAFGGTDLIMNAYRFAVQERFRFYSYGDAMLIL